MYFRNLLRQNIRESKISLWERNLTPKEVSKRFNTFWLPLAQDRKDALDSLVKLSYMMEDLPEIAVDVFYEIKRTMDSCISVIIGDFLKPLEGGNLDRANWYNKEKYFLEKNKRLLKKNPETKTYSQDSINDMLIHNKPRILEKFQTQVEHRMSVINAIKYNTENISIIAEHPTLAGNIERVVSSSFGTNSTGIGMLSKIADNILQQLHQ